MRSSRGDAALVFVNCSGLQASSGERESSNPISNSFRDRAASQLGVVNQHAVITLDSMIVSKHQKQAAYFNNLQNHMSLVLAERIERARYLTCKVTWHLYRTQKAIIKIMVMVATKYLNQFLFAYITDVSCLDTHRNLFIQESPQLMLVKDKTTHNKR